MRFSTQTIFTGLATLLSLTTTTYAADCKKGPFAPSTEVGHSSSGTPYCETGWDKGVVVTGIEVWARPWHLRGIQLSFSDGTKKMIGTPAGDSNEALHGAISWGVTDTVTQMHLWRNGAGDAVGRISMETSNGQKLAVGRDGGDNGESILTGSGVLLGAVGGVGDVFDSLSWLFLSTGVGKVEISALEFKEDLNEWNKKQKGIDREFSVADVYVVNPNKNIESTYWFRNQKVQTSTKELSQSYKNAFGLSVGVEVGGGVSVPFFASASVKVTTTASYNYESMSGSSTSDSSTYTVSWEQTAVIKPGRAVHCKATVQTGKYQSDYTSTITVHLTDGQKFMIKQPGTFASTGWSTSTSSCQDIAAKDAPVDAIVAKRGMSMVGFFG